MRRVFVFLAALLLAHQSVMADELKMTPVPDDFPKFIVPGHEREMDSIRRLFWLHYQNAGPLIPLWDEWMPMATLWPARGSGEQLGKMRAKWAATLSSRPMSDEGYVLTLQHDGPAHAHGWPFPGWHIAGGVGWHFRGTGIAGYDLPTVGPEGWEITGGKIGDVNDKGLVVELKEPRATLSHAGFTIAAKDAPWLRLNWWAAGLERANCYVEWTTREHPDFSPDRRAYFAPATGRDEPHLFMPMGGGGGKLDLTRGETRTMIPVYRISTWAGTITSFRIGFDNTGPTSVVIKSFHTACDTRHNVNNSNFIRGCHDYFYWSGDITFLRNQMPRIRSAMRFIEREFQTRQKKCVYTTWPGHEGRSGVRWIDGKKQIVRGEGIGSNYWDLLPFGGEDALATIYYYDAVCDLAELEEQIARHPQWCVAQGADAFDPIDLRKHADEVREYGTRRFWSETTGRFGTVDLDGQMHDYGFTFLNNEAVYFGFATPEQARSIHSWLSGERAVEGDTATGSDIYHWRFGPRSTTRRNLDYYFWGWSNPEQIPWGYQVQDGGAVLGWSYHDLMARLMTAGPDDAASRLRQIGAWFDETQAEGGYRAYYAKDPARGSMQGGNVAGGLGLDKEFFESVLVPQVMLYGFLGFRPTADGCAIAPRLPSDWPKLTVTRVHLRDQVLDITADAASKTISLVGQSPGDPIAIAAPTGWKVVGQGGLSVKIQAD
jgi:hypothetical protein